MCKGRQILICLEVKNFYFLNDELSAFQSKEKQKICARYGSPDISKIIAISSTTRWKTHIAIVDSTM